MPSEGSNVKGSGVVAEWSGFSCFHSPMLRPTIEEIHLPRRAPSTWPVGQEEPMLGGERQIRCRSPHQPAHPATADCWTA